MHTLQHLLATSVIEALEQREHVIIAPGRIGALCHEVEGIIAPSVPRIRARLDPAGGMEPEQGDGDGAAEFADEAVEHAVDAITEGLMESDHVDDIFADDRLLRRDALRAMNGVLRRYISGELDLGADSLSNAALDVELGRLGYMVSTVAQRAESATLRETLEAAAATVGTALARVDLDTGRASFAADGAAPSRLALEEAITEQLLGLVEADRVELPMAERVVRLSPQVSSLPGFGDALRDAVEDTHRRTACAAACTIVDEETLLATLSPLAEDAALRLDEHVDTFLERLEEAIEAAVQAASPPRKARGDRKSSRSSKAGSKKSSRPPRSSQRKTPSTRAAATKPRSSRSSTSGAAPPKSTSRSKTPSARASTRPSRRANKRSS